MYATVESAMGSAPMHVYSLPLVISEMKTTLLFAAVLLF